MPVVERLLPVLGELVSPARCLHLHDAHPRPVHVHDAGRSMSVLEACTHGPTICPVARNELVEEGLRLAPFTAYVLTPPRDELPQFSLDLLAAAHRLRSGAAVRRRNRRSETDPCAQPRAVRRRRRDTA